MSGIGERLREERERLGLSQGSFGEIGGVKANAQGNYEKGERSPDAAYLSAVEAAGVDVLYVVTGRRSLPGEVSPMEADLLRLFKGMSDDDQRSFLRLAKGMFVVSAGEA
ncbi:helix-turn-helix domain-containing protein [Pseudomonas sp. C9-3]|uniref:helix-turn-helix domain-containing protein n=1 Tax=Pseudomonas sp. C9-3 TaxID=3078264 RepID=UPI0028EFAEAF|nr:helix-turn-helix domain-containing protein [Pseudomonas sp. C9-3]